MKKKLLFPIVCFLGLSISLLGQNDSGFYSTTSIEEVKITFEQENWKYLLDSLRFNGDGQLQATIEINGNTYEQVGLCYRDSRSFQPGAKRNGLSLKLDYINKGQNHQGYTTIQLSSALRDPSMVREVLFYEIARQYMPAPKANYAKVDINGEYYGLFVNVEAIDKSFLQSHFGNSDGSFYKCSPDVGQRASEGCKSYVYGSLQLDNNATCLEDNFEKLSNKGWNDLMEFTKQLSKGLDAIEQYLHVDRTLWMLALNNVMVNLSSYSGQYSQSYYLYKDATGQFNPVIWDTNLSFGSYKNTGIGSDLNIEQLQQLDPLLHLENETKPLISVLLADSHYKKRYLSHLRTIIYDHFSNGKYESRSIELQQLIKTPFMEDSNKNYDLTAFNQSLTNTIGKRSKIPGLVELMKVRSSFLKKHPELAVVPPMISDITVMRREQFSRQLVKDFKIQAKVEKFPKQVKIWYRFGNDEAFKAMMMYDNGQSNDGQANDQIYGVSISPKAGNQRIEYYIQAENARAVSFHPSKYMYERHTATLSELNK